MNLNFKTTLALCIFLHLVLSGALKSASERNRKDPQFTTKPKQGIKQLPHAPLQCSFIKLGGCWPLYYILGAPKAATSSLWTLFRDHERSSRMNKSFHNSGICTVRKEMRLWANKAGFEKNTANQLVAQYLKHFMQTANKCPSGRFIEATPTYLGDPLASFRMSNYYPTGLQAKMRFIVSLRDAISRDLSWFNVMYSSFEKSRDALHRFDPIVAAKPNTADILVLKFPQFCIRDALGETITVLLPDSKRIDIKLKQLGQNANSSPNSKIIEPGQCYDMYSRINLEMYRECERSVISGDVYETALRIQISDTRVILERAIQRTTSACRSVNARVLNGTEDLKFLKELSEMSVVYQHCSQSSILRTGLYAPQILNWLHHFDPLQLLIINYHDIFDHGASNETIAHSIRDLFAHLLSSDMDTIAAPEHKLRYFESIETRSIPTTMPHANPTNTTFKLRAESISCDTYCELKTFYKRPTELLVELLSRIYGNCVFNSTKNDFSSLIPGSNGKMPCTCQK